MNPWLAAIIAMIAGAAAGLVTATLNVRFKILNLLASILTMIALFSVNLRVMGAPNISLISQDTMLTPFFGHGIPEYYVRPLFLFVLVAIAVFIVWRFLESDMGLAMRATGANPKMARAQGVRTDRQIYLGMALSNALVALGGALFAQTNGFADVTSGPAPSWLVLRRSSSVKRCCAAGSSWSSCLAACSVRSSIASPSSLRFPRDRRSACRHPISTSRPPFSSPSP